MTLLQANGHRIFPPRLRKRVRDEVCLSHGAKLPWRRSPFWLVLRVGLQRYLCALHGSEAGRVYYKFLICLFLTRLIDDSLGHLSPDILALLNAKLARRLFKLEAEKVAALSNIRPVYNTMFATLATLFHKSIVSARRRIEAAWDSFKRTLLRPIQPLPRVAEPKHLVLSLPNSGPYLQQILSRWRQSAPSESHVSNEFEILAATTTDFKKFANLCFSLSEIETDIKESCSAELVSTDCCDATCINIAKKLNMYLGMVANAYKLCPEQKSYMLLNVMDLWMVMDQCAVQRFDLLLEYNPGIPPGILDVLHLLSLKDMCRLQKIQNYLRDRFIKCNFSRRTIFDDPGKGCFAERYFDESSDSPRLQELQQYIETEAEHRRKEKEEQWQKLSEEFDELQRKIARTACISIRDDDNNLYHDDRGCFKCYLERTARRMRISVYEHPLPANPIHAKAVVFELECSETFTAYRDATWKILSTLARSKSIESFEPRVMLCNYPPFEDFLDQSSSGVSLASTAKSFSSTHFQGVSFPNNLKQVCLPNGLKLGYYDSLTKTWPGRQAHIPSFAHHCTMTIAASSPFSSLQLSREFVADSNGPSSYQVIASQTKCPSGLNVHEFIAYQTLFSGKYQRWPAMLVELGSSNLNFSTEAVTSLMIQLILQAGPAYELDPLRVVH